MDRLLKSRRHRVSALPGWAREEGCGFACFFSRTGDETVIWAARSPLVSVGVGEREREEGFTSAEWMRRKDTILRVEIWNAKNSSPAGTDTISWCWG